MGLKVARILRSFALALSVVGSTVALAGCPESRTEVIVVVDSDIVVPDRMDTIVVEAQGPESGTFLRRAMALLGDGERPLPRTVGLAHEGGPLGPFSVEVLGQLGGGTVVRRSAELFFQPRHTRVLPMHLFTGCQGVVCPADETCTERGCEPIEVDPEDLDEWSGSAPRLDATGFDAGGGGRDAGGPVDAGGAVDAGPRDSGSFDAGPVDAGASDAGPPADVG